MAEEYDKLVRDQIPAKIREDEKTPITQTVENGELADRLADKLQEEATEYAETREPEELADVLEVLQAIRSHRGLSEADLARLRSEKAERRGRFQAGIVLDRVIDTPPSDE